MAGGGRRGAKDGGAGGIGRRARHVLVVESPAKARTIGRYLGPEYRALATRGHVSDLPAKAGSVKPDDGFAMVTETGRGAARTLGAVAKALGKADSLVLATDPDREGEAIAWEVLRWLEERDALGDRAVHRVAFHEVTPAAVRTALARPRDIDMDLVRAWQARRALDYLVGYGLSPILWRKVPGCRSAGRVQSVALRLLCEREAEIEAFVPRHSWTVEAEIETGGARFTAALCRLDGAAVGDDGLAAERSAEDAARRIRDARLAVTAVERDTLRRRPPPPFTTSTLQQEAARRLGFGIGETMEIAQRLYEGVDLGSERAGLTTYMRTDSTAMAKTAIAEARAVARRRFGDDYVPAKARAFRSRSQGGGPPRFAQEAHEAIRPTGFARAPEDVERRLDRAAAALYGLIWKRALASQMAEARLDRVRVELAPEAAAGGPVLAATGSAMAFDGHLRVWREDGDGESETESAGDPLPALATGAGVSAVAVRVERQVTEPPPRYTEAGLVRGLDDLGIGRPSTWTAILAVLQERGYAVLHDRRFVPTERGRVVTAFLEAFFGQWVDTGFTAAMEADLDRIAQGALAWRGMLENFWGAFHGAVEDAGTLKRAAVLAAVEGRLEGFLFGAGPADRRCPACRVGELELKLSRYGPFVGCAAWPACGYRRRLAAAAVAGDGYTGPRELGTDPHTGQAVTLRRGPNGWYVQRGAGQGRVGGGAGGGAKPERMSLPPPVEPDSVDLDIALRLLALPREVGSHPESGKQILAGIGRYGPWLRHEETCAAIPGGDDVLTIGINRSVALIADKTIRESRARGPKQVLRKLGVHPGDGAPVWLKTGHFGPFVAHRRRYASLPKDAAPDEITLDEAVGLLDR